MALGVDIIRLTFKCSSRVLWRTYVGFEKSGVCIIGLSPPDHNSEKRSIWMKNDHTSRLTIPLLMSSPVVSQVKNEIVPVKTLGTRISCQKVRGVKTTFQLLEHIKAFEKKYSKHRHNMINVNAISTPSSEFFPSFYVTFES
jgi:hypothetical protein